MSEPVMDDSLVELTRRLTEVVVAARERNECSIAVAESLTGGQLAGAISSCSDAGEWFRGAIVAYHPDVKHGLLETPPGSVVTAETAVAMAESTARLLDASLTVALTGVGGPGSDEGEPAGTVYLAISARSVDASSYETLETDVELLRFTGSPIEVVRQTIGAALTALIDRVERSERAEPAERADRVDRAE